MKQYITWMCDRCNALFEFEIDAPPLRCPDCLSPKDHLHRVETIEGQSVEQKSIANTNP